MNINTQNQNTHFIFDGEKVIISPDLHDVIKFLHEVEKETESFLSYEKRLDAIRQQHLETLELVQLLSEKLKENSIDFTFTFSESPITFGEKLHLDRPIRSEMIALFAHLETIFCLNLAYTYKQSDEVEIFKLARDEKNMKKFINTFCLNENNEWCKKNLDRFKRISADDIRSLRNFLTHFYSVSKKLSIFFSYLDDKSRRLEKATKYKAKFITPEDLYEIIKGAAILIIKMWSNDYKNDLKNNSSNFKDRIEAVKSIVYKSGAIIIKSEQLNI